MPHPPQHPTQHPTQRLTATKVRRSPLTRPCGLATTLLFLQTASWDIKAAEAGVGPRGASAFPAGERPYLAVGGSNVPPLSADLFDDDEDDDFEGLSELAKAFQEQQQRATARKNGGGGNGGMDGKSLQQHSAGGGSSSSAPDPIRTQGGISIGGASANGVTRNSPLSAIHINPETGSGSNETVVDFNFPDADILAIANTLGKLTGTNFIYDSKEIKGRITIVSNSRITVSEAWKVFLTALDVNGYSLIPSGKYLRIARQKDARDKQLHTYSGDFAPDTDALITRVIPLKFISSEDVARTLRNFVPQSYSRMIAYEQTNTLIVTDTGANIVKLMKMLELLDVEGFDAGIEVIPVRYASAADLSKLIDSLIPGTAPLPNSQSGGGNRLGGAGGRFAARRTKEGGIINTIIADERTNNLIIHANSKGAQQVRALVTQLDANKPLVAGAGKVHVIYLQFADAEALANTLNNFSQTSGNRAGGGGGSSGQATGTGVNPMVTNLFQGAIKVSADKSTNALVVTASASDFLTVKSVVSKLDIKRDQVYIEAVIMEVSVTSGFSFGANLAALGGVGNGSGTLPVGSTTNTDIGTLLAKPLELIGNGLLAPIPIGGTGSMLINGTSVAVPNFLALITALQQFANGNVLATPQIIALDNSEAMFESAEKIPVPRNNQIVGGGVSTGYDSVPVAISLKIKPQINKITNFVKLDIEAKLGTVSNRVLPKGVADFALATQDRTAKTTAIVGDRDTIVLGGLTREETSDKVSKVPLLGDIPLLGWLFRSKISSTAKNNLLIFMTPHIVRPYEQMRAILDRKLKERDTFLEATTGGLDSVREQRDAMIRSLPDLETLKKERPASAANLALEEETERTNLQDAPGDAPAGGGDDAGAVNGLPQAQP